MIRTLAAALLAAAMAAPALAQTPPPPVRVRGTVEKLENAVMTVKLRDGGTVAVKLADDYKVAGVSKAKIGDIKQGTYIGTATVGERNGALVALEVHIFPEAMRGLGEGHYAWDLKADSKMTNANVATVTSVGKDQVLTVQYKGGEQKILVAPKTTVVVFSPADRKELKKGAHIFCTAQRAPDGSLAAARVNVGLHGITPPM
jgi:hypothetical protein